MYSNGVSLIPASYSSLFTTSQGGTLAVPVKPNAVLYTQLNYIHGISSGSENGVSVNKIRILNTLINQLVTMKKNTAPSEDFSLADDEKQKALIYQYQKELQTAMAQAEETGYGLAGVQPEAGALFTISA